MSLARAAAVFALVVIPIDPAVLAVSRPAQPFGSNGAPTKPPRPALDGTPPGLSDDAWNQIRHATRESEYRVARGPGKTGRLPLEAVNRRQRYRTTFRGDGIEIAAQASSESWRLDLAVTGYGHQGDVRRLDPVEPEASGDRVDYHHGPVTVWYVNRPTGLEQGFTLHHPPSRREGPLVIRMLVGGDLQPTAKEDGASFSSGSHEPLLRYAGLKSWDANGRPVSSRVETGAGQLSLVIEPKGARFPITVDPTFVHTARLTGDEDEIASGGFGYAVSIYLDTVVVGAPFETTPAGFQAGAAYVFVATSNGWLLEQKLLASDAAPDDSFGWSVSASAAGVVVGAPHYLLDGQTGAAYVFVNDGVTWIEQQKLVGSDTAPDDHFGVAVSGSIETIVVGADLHDVGPDEDTGAAYVFRRTGTTWAEEQKLLSPAGLPSGHFGASLSMSISATATLVVGQPGYSGTSFVFVRAGTTWSLQQQLIPPTTDANEHFGWSVALSEDTAVIGTPGYSTPSVIDAGTAWVFVRSGAVWTVQQQLLASDASEHQEFGKAVTVSYDTAVIGGATEAAYVFTRPPTGANWTQQQKIVPSDLKNDASFGFAVGVWGTTNTVIVGAPFDSNPVLYAGSVYVFVPTGPTWGEEQKLLGTTDSALSDNFGLSVAVSASGDTVVVGAPLDDTPAGVQAGSAYVFVREIGVWWEQQKLLASDGAADDRFGSSVAISGETVVVGATHAPGEAGAAYVFVRSSITWSEEQKLVPLSGSPNDQFGNAVSIAGDTAVIGARGDGPSGPGSGSAYVFVRSGTTWTEQQKLAASDGTAGDNFGSSVSVSADTAVLGADNDDTAGGMNAGSAYVFVRSATTWSEQQKLLPSSGASLDYFGKSACIDGDTVVVGAPFIGPPPGPEERGTRGAGGTGSAFVFVRAGAAWSEQQRLLASDASATDWFGHSVSILGDTVVIGAPHHAGGAGAAYVFDRSGTTWTEQQQLQAPPPAGGPYDSFGYAVSLSPETVVAGAPYDDTLLGQAAGSAHVFAGGADLGVTKTDGQSSAVPGEPIAYTIVVSNKGPNAAPGATVTDALPPELLGATWTCVASPGSTCTASGTGGINDIVSLLPAGTATYTLVATIDPAASSSIFNIVDVTSPPAVPDPNLADNYDIDADPLDPTADVSVTKTDSADPVSPGDPLTYVVSVSNAGPSNAGLVTMDDVLPQGVTFVSSVPGSPTCTFAHPTLTCSLGMLAVGGATAVTINVTVDPQATGMLVNTATAFANASDYDPRDNTATAATAVGRRDGELSHGTNETYDLAALPGPAQDEDIFRIEQKPYSSYEVVVDATSGDIGANDTMFLTRLGSDGTTALQASAPVGAGFSRSLRWMNDSATENEAETIRVRSTECTTDCGADDIYRIRAYETTLSAARFNNSGTQVTVLVLQNPTNEVISGHAYFRSTDGALLASEYFILFPYRSSVINTAAVPGAAEASGAITVAHDGRYGELVGKAVAVEPATGFSFDTPLVPRVK